MYTLKVSKCFPKKHQQIRYHCLIIGRWSVGAGTREVAIAPAAYPQRRKYCISTCDIKACRKWSAPYTRLVLRQMQAQETSPSPSTSPPLRSATSVPRDLEAERGLDGGAEPLSEMPYPSPSLEALEALSPPLAAVPLGDMALSLNPGGSMVGPHGVVNAFGDVPDDLFGASFWLDTPEFVGGPAPASAMFPSVCSAPVGGARLGAAAVLGAKGSCDSITEHYESLFEPLAGDAFERACERGAVAAPLPPLPPRSRSVSDAGSSPSRSPDGPSPILSPNPSTGSLHPAGLGANPVTIPSGNSKRAEISEAIEGGAGELEPMQEEGMHEEILQALSLLDRDVPDLAAVQSAVSSVQGANAQSISCGPATAPPTTPLCARMSGLHRSGHALIPLKTPVWAGCSCVPADPANNLLDGHKLSVFALQGGAVHCRDQGRHQ